MSNHFSDDDEDLVDTSCYEHLKLAVEELLLTPDLSRGLKGAFLQLAMLRDADFSGEATQLFSAIMVKHDEVIEKARCRLRQDELQSIEQMEKLALAFSKLEGTDYQPLILGELAPEPSLFYRHQYMLIHPRTKYWFKERIWRLFTRVRCNDR